MSSSSEHCTFCDIIHGAGEVSLCYEDADALAFMDIQPVNAGHVLVVPRAHHETLEDVPPQLAMHLFDIAMRVSAVVRGVTGCKDLNIVVNSGAAAGQDVFHYHVHVIPRREGDGFDIPLPFGGSAMPDRTVLDAMAARIISALRDPMRAAKGRGDGGAGEKPGAMRADAARGDAPVERARAVRTYRERMPTAAMPAFRDDVADAAPRARWSLPYEGAHGELRRDD